MFLKKKEKKEQPAPMADVHIETMPSIFYGGNDPDIYHHTETEFASTSAPAGKTTAPNVQPKIASKKYQQPKEPMSAKKKWILISSIAGIFLLIVAGISWYYLRDYFAPAPAPVQQRPVISTTPTTTSSDSAPVVTPTTTDQTASSTLDLPPSLSVDTALQFPTLVLNDSTDIDNDQLTDREEELYDSDSGTPDTDKDGYFDGQEIFNLYDPKGPAPRKLIDAGLVREYTNPLTNYRLYFPLQWQIGDVDTLGRHVIFSNIDGDYIEVRTFDKQPNQTFSDWFGATVQDKQRITDLLPFVNRFKVEGWRRRDDMVAYFVDQNKVYIVMLHPAELGPVVYRHVLKMAYQSFRYSTTTQTLEEQVIIPGATSSPTTTTQTPSTTSTQSGASTTTPNN